MLQGDHSAILSTFIKLPFVIKIFVLSNLEWLLKTGFTVTCISYAFATKYIFLNGMFVFWFGLMLYIPVNSYGQVGMVSSPNHTFFLGKLD